jgi:methionyl-tRNA formyltransferase
MIWKLPPLGTFNLHASLLPQYRGAAPINWTIINGETETGVTTFFLSQSIDTGHIIFQEKIRIHPDETAGELHDRLMELGSDLVLRTVKAIESGTVPTTDQQSLIGQDTVLKKAPKIGKEDCRIDWKQSCEAIRNKIRGLSPYPGAFTILSGTPHEDLFLKIFRATSQTGELTGPTGRILTDHKTYFGITTPDGIVYLKEVQLASKKRMSIAEFIKGFPLAERMLAL